jgi:hypothetical protein
MLLIAGAIWSALSAQFLVQTITSLVLALIYLTALPFSRVKRNIKIAGVAASFSQSMVFGALFIGGNWFAAEYINFMEWSATTIASLVMFLVSIVYCVLQIPDKVLIARFIAWKPFFAEAMRARPQGEQLAFARRVAKDPAEAGF